MTPRHRAEPVRPKLFAGTKQLRKVAAATAFAVIVAAFAVPTAQAVNSPTAAPVSRNLINDSMSRTAAKSWGKSASGVSYKTSFLADLKVSNGTGQVAITKAGTSRTVIPSALPTLDSSGEFTISLSKIPTSGNGAYSSWQLRSNGKDYYQVAARFLPNSKLELEVSRVNKGIKTILGKNLTVPVAAKSGSRVKVEYQLQGKSPVSLKARAWLESSKRPDWQKQEADSSAARLSTAGAANISSYVASASQAAVFSYDNLVLNALNDVPAAPAAPTTASSPSPATSPAATSGASTNSASETPATTDPAPTVSPQSTPAETASWSDASSSQATPISSPTTEQAPNTSASPAAPSPSETVASQTPTATESATATDSPAVTIPATATTSATASSSETADQTEAPTESASPSPSSSTSASASPSASQSPSASPSTSSTPSPSTSPSATSSSSPSQSATPSPSETPTPTPTKPVVEPPNTNSGSVPVGTSNYPVPSDAVFVATTGSNTMGTGTIGAPYRTIATGIAKAASGGTVVIRGGSYHESVVIPAGKTLTLQSYPLEGVWLEGSEVVPSFAASGSNYVASNWNYTFDSSPTYTWAAPDGTTPGWGFVSPNYPMAAHPDQVWIDGVAQKQVATLAEVSLGKFFVDYTAAKLYLGSNPTGKVVRASSLKQALNVRSSNSIVRGIGVQRYAPSVPHMGTVTLEKPFVVLENVSITDNSTTGLAVASTDVTVRNVTVARNGMLGANAAYSDRLKVIALDSYSNNLERFNNSPVSGGMKIGRTRTVSVIDSTLHQNLGPGLWFDESVYDMTITGNRLTKNSGHGMSVEISAKAAILNNVFADNTGNGVKINGTSQVQLWSNTFIGNNRQINIVQDERRAANPATPGHDPRQPFPDKTMTWINGPVSVRNNVIAIGNGKGNCLLCVEDFSQEFSASQMGVTSSGNTFQRRDALSPTWVVVWSRGAGNPAVFTTIDAFTKATGQDKGSLDMIGAQPASP